MVETKSVLKKLAKWTAILVMIGGVCGAAGLAGIFYYYGRDLPNIIDREDFKPPQISRVYSADGHVIGEFFTPGAKRTVVSLEKIPDHVKHAFMAAEDADFYVHEGIDYLGLVRAFYYAIFYDTGLKGTSTITQQVIKNLVLTPEKKIERKIKEFILARELERDLTKDDILFLYLNTIYLGHGVNGIQEAARLYFAKPVEELSLAESATLAGLTQSPERHSPLKHPERTAKRRKFVLEQMWQKGFIEEAAYRKASEEVVTTAPRNEIDPHLWIAPHFTEYLRLKLIKELGKENVLGGGLAIHTTLRVKDQVAANAAVLEEMRNYDERRGWYGPVRLLKNDAAIARHHKKMKTAVKRGLDPTEPYEAVVTHVAKDGVVSVRLGDIEGILVTKNRRIPTEPKAKEKRTLKKGHVVRVSKPKNIDAPMPTFEFAPGPEVALISIDPHTRHVTALVGGVDFKNNQFNHALKAELQTGSTFKPIVYAAALETKRVTPATTFLDSPYVVKMDHGPDWSPKNSDGTWRGSIRLREALGASRNVVAARLISELGVPNAIEFAKKVGVTSKLVENETMVLGSSELRPIELTNAYATFAAGGRYADPLMVTRIESKLDASVREFDTEFEQRIDPGVAYLITFLMTATVHGYTDRNGKRRGGTASRLAKLGHRTAGKTGTTNETADAWFIGYTADRVTGVWVGFSGKKRTLGSKEGGGKTAAPVWLNFMQRALDKVAPKEFARPDGLVDLNIDPMTGLRAREGGITETFLEGTEPTDFAPEGDEQTGDDFLLNQLGGLQPTEDEE